MKLKLYRDKVISIVRGKYLVGVYVITKKDTWTQANGIEYNIGEGLEILLAEMSPEKADKIIKLWNSK